MLAGRLDVRLIVVLVLALMSAGPALAERRVALVIAADSYRNIRPLQNAVNDGRAVETALAGLGFAVTLETDRDLRRMRRALEDFREDAAGVDVALVYFSGHGVEIGGENRLLPVDAAVSSLDDLKATSLPLEEIRDTVAEVAKVGLVVLDACRNDPFGTQIADGRGAAALSESVAKAVRPGLGRVGRADNILFAFSAAPGATASDGDGDNSPFTAALTKYLGTEGLEIRSVLTLVQQEVYDLSRGRQLPYVESGLPALFFAAGPAQDLPERDRLLLAMADITPELRAEVETVAADVDMPLAPLYAALITSDGEAMPETERRNKLREAAAAFVQVRLDLRNFSSSDPGVAALRKQAEATLALGAFDEARDLLQRAARIDGESREDLKANFIERTLSEAATHYLAGSAARAELRYALSISDYEKAVALHTEVETFDIPDDARYQHVLSLELIGTMQLTVGNLARAGSAFEAMVKAAERRAAAQPENVSRQRDVVVARNKVAEVRLSVGDVGGAIAEYEEAREKLKGIIDREPRLEYLRDLAVSYNRTGDARRISGDVNGALLDYRAGLKVAEFLVSELPGDDGFRRDLGVSHSKLGFALRMANNLEPALAEYEAALSITEALARKAPDDMELQRDLTVSLNSIGDIRRLTGDNAGAFEPYRRSVEISRELVKRDPANTLWRRDLSVGLGKLGNARRAAADLPGALADYRSAHAIVEYLTDLDPSNAEWQRDLSVSHNKLGDVLLEQGDRTGAAAQYKAGFTIAEVLAAADPANVQRATDLAYSRYKLGSAGIDAVANFKSALDILTGLKAQGRLPGAFEGWIAMVETALKAAGGG